MHVPVAVVRKTVFVLSSSCPVVFRRRVDKVIQNVIFSSSCVCVEMARDWAQERKTSYNVCICVWGVLGVGYMIVRIYVVLYNPILVQYCQTNNMIVHVCVCGGGGGGR